MQRRGSVNVKMVAEVTGRAPRHLIHLADLVTYFLILKSSKPGLAKRVRQEIRHGHFVENN